MTENVSVPLAAAHVLLRMSERVGKLLSHSWAGGGLPKHFVICKSELPPRGCMPLQTSQVEVYIHVSPDF